jgi:hypothetical protein
VSYESYSDEELEQLYADAMERRSEAGERIERANDQADLLRLARQQYRLEHNDAMEILKEIEKRRRKR